jgi:hypothetical protein
MTTDHRSLSCEIELRPGEQLQLPRSVTDRVGPGHWLITIQPADAPNGSAPVRNHSAFLGSYAIEDEGLYDDYPAR